MFKDADGFLEWLYGQATAMPSPNCSETGAACWLQGLDPGLDDLAQASLEAWIRHEWCWPVLPPQIRPILHLRLMCAYLFLMEGHAHGYPMPLTRAEVREVLGQLTIELWSEGRAGLMDTYDLVTRTGVRRPGCN